MSTIAGQMKRILFGLALVVSLVGSAWAQPATDAQKAGVTDTAGCGTMHLATKLGSFRIIDGHGRVEFTFSGTVLINKLKGNVEATGNLRKEYESKDRVIYFGKGKIIVTGDWRAVHWFGREMNATWFGRGMVRLSGEFDREQKTGEYWFDDPLKKNSWPGGSTIDVPNPQITPGFNPNVKIKKKG